MQRLGRFPRSMRRLAANSGALALLGSETDGVAFDFRDLTVAIRDTTTPANTFSGGVEDRLTYTAPSTKWIRNSAGVLVSGTTLRTEYDASLNALGVRSEPAATNLVLRSQEFSSAGVWTLSRILAFGSGSTDNAIPAPDGTTTAEKIVEDTALGTHRVGTAVTISAGAAITVSVWFKAGERTYAQIRMSSDAEANHVKTTFNLSTGAITSSTSVGTATHISSVSESWGSGWYRCSVTATVDPAATTMSVLFQIVNNAPTDSYTGDGVSGLYVWGAQVESGRWMSSYIPTTSATVTRAADVIRMAATLFPAMGTTGAVFVRGTITSLPNPSSFLTLWALADAGIGADYISAYIRHTTGISRLLTKVATVTQTELEDGASTTTSAGAAFRSAGTWALNSFAYSVNGAAVGTDGVGSVPGGSINRMVIGGLSTTDQQPYHISQLLAVPRRVANGDLPTFGGTS